MKVLIPLIAYGGMCHVEFAMSLMSLVMKMRDEDIEASIQPITFESLISRGRNAAVAYALKGDYSHLLFIDSDISFDPDDAIRLLKSGKDVCVGAYPKKYLSETKMQHIISNRKYEDWAMNSTDFSTELTKKALAEILEGQKSVETNYAATGFMSIKAEVFHSMIEKFPDLKYINDIDGYMGAGDHFYDFFKAGVNPVSKKYESEDYGFCQLWRSLGGNITILPDITLSHIGKYAFKGNVSSQVRAYVSKND